MGFGRVKKTILKMPGKTGVGPESVWNTGVSARAHEVGRGSGNVGTQVT